MLPCTRRQKVVKKRDGKQLTILRCISKESVVNGQEVTENLCAQCPVRKFQREKAPCEQPNPEHQQVLPPTPIQDKKASEEVKEIVAGTVLEDMEGFDLSEADEMSPDYPALSMQLWSYKEALVRWKKAGYPVRTDEEVKEIHEKKCVPCSWYDKDKKRCKGCGCRVSAGSVAVLNKIKMATEHCPREEW